MTSKTADICLILEGTYPYVSGGVSGWTHSLISSLPEKTFHLLCILPPEAETDLKYDVPDNVVDISHIRLQKLEHNEMPSNIDELMRDIEGALIAITGKAGNHNDYKTLLDNLRHVSERVGYAALTESEAAWDLIRRMYEAGYAESSFLDYFWSWRALMGSLFSVALAELPDAKVYHTLSTGYAGMVAARAKHEKKRPVIITEHGIYTNERRIEVASAEWLEETASKSLTIDHTRNNLRDFWSNTFASFSRICYQACDHIYTLFEGNKKLQVYDGAKSENITIIPNGVDVDRFSKIEIEAHDRATFALIGRVVPIKDIKSFLRATSIVHENIPDIQVYIMGPTDEEPEYYKECQQMVEYMGLQDNVSFTGQVNIDRYLGKMDLIVLSSISEAMPLTVLEAGAAGIPSVTTDVGACKEILYGRTAEDRAIGDGGIVVPLSNPTSLAEGILTLLSNGELRGRMGQAMRERVRKYYAKSDQIDTYNKIYSGFIAQSK